MSDKDIIKKDNLNLIKEDIKHLREKLEMQIKDYLEHFDTLLSMIRSDINENLAKLDSEESIKH